MSVRIEPTVGRIVWFYSTRDLGWGEHTDTPDKPRAAIVADVLGPDHVNLCVIDRFGNARPMSSVRLVQDGETRQDSEVHWAEWMPYQKGMAAKQPDGQAAKQETIAAMGPVPSSGTFAQSAGQARVPQQSPRRPPPVEEADLSSNETRPPAHAGQHPKPLSAEALKDLSD